MIRINTDLVAYLKRVLTEDHDIAEVKFDPDEIVLKERKTLRSVYVIKEGIAKCYLTEDTGKDFIQEFFGSGEIFGEVEMLHDDLSFCTIQAITELMVYKIPFSTFGHLLENDKKFNRLILKGLASKIKYKAIRHAFNQSHAIEVNLQRLEKEMPNLHQMVSKRDIANYLGVTERSLNRILKSSS